MILFVKKDKVIAPRSQEQDPLYNPNEITRVADILELHKRGIRPSLSMSLKGEIQDDRSEADKLNSPNTENDKLYPTFSRLVQCNAQYAKVLESDKAGYENQIKYEEMLKEANSQTTEPQE